MSLVLSVLVFVAVIVLAVQGVGYRGLYFALAVAALGFGAIVRGMIPSDREILLARLGSDRALEAGQHFFADFGPPLAFCLFALASAPWLPVARFGHALLADTDFEAAALNIRRRVRVLA